MHGIRIWHLAALALAVPLLAINVPAGCDGLLNPDFVAGVGGDGASAGTAAPDGFIVLGFYNYTGYNGRVQFAATSATAGRRTGYDRTLYANKPTFYLWACGQYLSELDLLGGEVLVPDDTAVPQAVAIDYDGGPLGGSLLTEPLECGTLIKANVRFVTADEARIDIELIK